MEKKRCELCDGVLKRQGNFFVCQECGTKYPLEETKRKISKIDIICYITLVFSGIALILSICGLMGLF